MSNSKTGKKKLDRSMRRKAVAELRLEGYTIARIADELECGLATVKRDLDFILDTYGKETDKTVTQYRRVQMARIEELIKGLWKKGKLGQVTAVDRLVKLFERQSKLMGLDKPTKIAPTNPSGDEPFEMTDAELDAEIAKILAGKP